MRPSGARYVPNYIDQSHEGELLGLIDDRPWLGTLKRRVQHYGFLYDYKARRISRNAWLGPLPIWLEALAERLQRNGVLTTRPDQVIVNEYLPGQGIAAHVDCEPCFGNTIASLSLGSTCIMEFSNPRSEDSSAHLLEPQSLLILKDVARSTGNTAYPHARPTLSPETKWHVNDAYRPRSAA